MAHCKKRLQYYKNYCLKCASITLMINNHSYRLFMAQIHCEFAEMRRQDLSDTHVKNTQETSVAMEGASLKNHRYNYTI